MKTTAAATTRVTATTTKTARQRGGVPLLRLGPRLGFAAAASAPRLSAGLAPRAFNSATGSGEIEEVEWQAENANSVTLIGRLGREPEVKYLEDGKVTANVSLAVSRGKTQSAHWFELDFWNEDARMVAENLRKGQQVQVQGRLTQNTWRDKMTGAKREKIRVVCNRVALVAGGGMMGDQQRQQGYDSFQGQPGRSSYGGGNGGYGGGGNGGGSSSSVASKDVEGRWAALFCSPGDFWDNRATKRNPKAPDFKHKETGEALWVESRNTPAWVASSLKELDMNKQVDINSLFTSQQGGQVQQQQGGGGGGHQQRGTQEEIPF